MAAETAVADDEHDHDCVEHDSFELVDLPAVGFCADCGVVRCRKGFGLGVDETSWARAHFRADYRNSRSGDELRCLGCQQRGQQRQSRGVIRRRTADFARYRGWFGRQNPGALPVESRLPSMPAAARLASACWFWSAAHRGSPVRASLAALVMEPAWTRTNVLPAARPTHCSSPGCGRSVSAVARRSTCACRLCGKAFCDQCLHRSIRVWSMHEQGSVVGPDSVVVDLVRPGHDQPGARVLRGCGPCIDLLGRASPGRGVIGSRTDLHPTVQTFLSVHSALVDRRAVVGAALPVFKTQVEALLGASDCNPPDSTATGKRVVIKTLAKQQADLASIFAQYHLELNLLRRECGAAPLPGSPPTPPSHRRVAQSAAQSHAGFLRERLWEFKRLQRELRRSVSADVLEAICVECDVLAVTSVLCILLQLGLELVAFQAAELAAERVAEAVVTVEAELAAMVERRRQPWLEHRSAVQLQVQAMTREAPQLLQFFKQRDWCPLVRARIQKSFKAMTIQLQERGTRLATAAVLAALERGRVDVDAALERLIDASPVVDGDWELV